MSYSRAHPQAFYDQDFGFRRRLEASWRDVLEEWDALPRSLRRPWPQRGGYEGVWEVFGLYASGMKFRANCRLMPKTTALVEQVPRLVQAGFSILGPHTWLPPHTGDQPAILRSHLGLHSPPESGLRVEEQVRHCAPGQTLVFDDNLEHEAWNRGPQEKVVLMVDFLRPLEMMDGVELRPDETTRKMAIIAEHFGDWLAAE